MFFIQTIFDYNLDLQYSVIPWQTYCSVSFKYYVEP